MDFVSIKVGFNVFWEYGWILDFAFDHKQFYKFVGVEKLNLLLQQTIKVRIRASESELMCNR
jgi:hypothetical protein